jgi:predicted Zn-dependent protease with MMP-like domain
MTRGDFERLVEDAVASIPEEFHRYLENVTVVVEDEPSVEVLRSVGLDPRRDTLFGLYQGVPWSKRPHDYAGMPDHISIFMGPLLRAFGTRERLEHQVRTTVIHEIAHFFGLTEGRIRRLGY